MDLTLAKGIISSLAFSNYSCIHTILRRKIIMKFVLVEYIEREINTPDCFKSHEEAYKEMRKRMAEVLSIEPEELEEFEDWGDEAGISCDNNSAWITDYHHNNYDWKIFEMEF